MIVSVFDPREIPNKTDYSLKGELYCEFKYAPFSCLIRRSHQQDSEEKHYSILMKQALEPAVCRQEFPNFQVDIYALVLQNDGSALSAAITCAGLALAHAGVPMFDLVTSVTVAVQIDRLLVDPTLEEEEVCHLALQAEKNSKNYHDHGIVLLSMLSTHQQISQFYQIGNLSAERLCDFIEVLSSATKDIVPLVEQVLVTHVVKSVKKEAED